jgi:hypothetical protein
MINENSNQMQVYVVIGGFDYEGESVESLQMFDCKSTAEMYSKDLEDGDNNSGLNATFLKYDYVEMRLQGVVMNSMIAPLK